MIGSGAPALRAIAHLLRNQIIQYHVTVFRRVYLYGFSDRRSCPFIKYNCAPHTCPLRLLSPKPQTYPLVNV